jgi:uncharacterized protein involved in exopolysaccharide biosynthesis
MLSLHRSHHGDLAVTRVHNAILWVQRARNRRLAYLGLALVLAVLCVVPRPWVARAKLLPQDSSSAGLGQILNSLGGQLSSFANLLSGGRPPNDLYLVIGRSAPVTTDVVKALNLVGPDRRYSSDSAARIALGKKVDVHLLLGGVVEIEARTRDPEEALQLTTAYQNAISGRIAALGRETMKRKAQIVRDRFKDASDRVAQSERTLDEFRRANRLAAPEQQLGSEIMRTANLQAQIQAKQVEVQSLAQIAGPENVQLQTVHTQLAALQGQLAATNRPSLDAGGPNVSGLSQLQSRYLNLYRDYRFAQGLYDVYARASEQSAVENIVAESATYIQVIEPANLDPARHYNIPAVGLLVTLVLLALFTELYVPATGLRWSDVLGRSDDDTRK